MTLHPKHTKTNTEQCADLLTTLKHIDQVLSPKIVTKCPDCNDEAIIQVNVETIKHKASHLTVTQLSVIQENKKPH